MYVPLHYTKREFSRKVTDTFMMLVPVQTSDGSSANRAFEFGLVKFEHDPSLLTSDFSISALAASGNIEAFERVRLGDNDRFGSAAAVQSFTSMADAAATYVKMKGGQQ